VFGRRGLRAKGSRLRPTFVAAAPGVKFQDETHGSL
jgi:hypothetical protein